MRCGAGLIIRCIDMAGDDVTCCLWDDISLIICVSYQWQHNLPELCRLFICCTDLFSYITLFSTPPVRCVNIYARDDQTVGSFLSLLEFFFRTNDTLQNADFYYD